jgi:hypothetical protein
MAFGRWRPPEGQACYVDAFQPRELPAISALLDSAAVVNGLRGVAKGSVLIALAFDESGRVARTRVIDRRMPLASADSVRALLERHLRSPTAEEWGARLLVSSGAEPTLALARREVCPPMLARIDALALAHVPLTEREPDVAPAPDYVLRGVAADGPPRSTVERVVSGAPLRDSARLTLDSTSTAPDVAAVGDSVLTLRVLIDTAGVIAHAEIARAATASVDRDRLVAELARYRFHPALEDRVPIPAWVILKIK